jgi:cupin superfamily protein
MSTSPTPLLSALCGPQPASGLLGESWPPAPFVNHGDPARLPAALKAPELSSLARLFAVYRGMVSFGNARSDSRTFAVPQADPGLLFRMGLSLYLTDIADCIPALAPMLRSLEAELGAPAGCARIGAFAAARGNGVTCHLDAEEVFSIQLAGRKRFRYAPAPDLANPWGRQFNPGDPCDDDLYPQVAEGFPDPRKAHFQSAEMRPGSVLFMPRGTWHETEADEDSLSVSIIVRMPTALDCALEALRARLLQDPRWRQPLYGAWATGPGQEAARAHWKLLAGAAGAVGDGLALEDALLAVLSTADRLPRAGAHSRYQRRPEARLVLQARPQGGFLAEVVARDRSGNEVRTLQLEVPPAMATTVEWLAKRDAAFAAQDLIGRFPSLPREQHLRILDALVRGGLLCQLWFSQTPEGGARCA